MERTTRIRGRTRHTVNELLTEVKEELSKNQPDLRVLRAHRKLLMEYSEELTIYNDQIRDMMYDNVTATDDQHNNEAKENHEYRKKTETVLQFIEEKLGMKAASPPPSITGSETKRNFKLPKIELKKFNGDYEEYLGWWAQFSKIHEDETLHEADKFHYLVQAMVPATRAHKLVKSYPATVENYPKVIEALQDRFGDKTLLAEVYIRRLQSIVLGLDKNKTRFDLCKIYDDIETQLRSLESLEIVLDHSAFLLPLIESTLPDDLLRVWQRCSESGHRSEEKRTTEERLKSLLQFLKNEVKGEERIKMINGTKGEKDKPQTSLKGKFSKDAPTSQSLFAGSSKSCLFCSKSNHLSQDCLKASHMTLEERTQRVKEGHCCFRCLRYGHNSKDCRASVKCSTCGKKHLAILCRGKQPTGVEEVSVKQITDEVKGLSLKSGHSGVSNANLSAKEGLVLMKTVQVDIVDIHGGKYRVRLLFDEGSNRSYIKSTTAERMKCQVLEEFNLQTTLFGGQTTVMKPKKKYSVRLHSSNSNFKGEFEFINEDTICGNCPRIPKGPWMQELPRKKIFVCDTGPCSTEIQILIGSNLWPKLMTGKMVKLANGLVAVESVFGWTLSGEIPHQQAEVSNFSSTVFAMLTQGERSLPDLWNLETIGIRDPIEKLSQKDHDALVKCEFQKKIGRDQDGRYIVSLPWIDKNIPLPNYKNACQKCLVSLTGKLVREDLYATYEKIFKDWEEEGIIQEVHTEGVQDHYLPHHRVLKLDSRTTPVRPVFNASFKIGRHPSLNECMERGPNLLELIPTIFLRFREKDIGVISDIRKAFQMIGVEEEDQNFQKFLWWGDQQEIEFGKKSGEVPGVGSLPNSECGLGNTRNNSGQRKIKVYRHCRVVFGMNCSPFILAAVLEYHFMNIQDKRKSVIQLLKDSIYVDNSVISFDSRADYKRFKEMSISILADAKMELRQWESSCEESQDINTNVLGMVWNKAEDTLSCKVPNGNVEGFRINKRNVLSIISQIYDPIGFTVPALVHPKVQLQNSWSKRGTWDDEWNPSEKKKFATWHSEISEIGRIAIPRIAIGSKSDWLELHLFTDASQDAYAAVVYARVQFKDQVKVQLLLAKSRLAPLTKKNNKYK